MDDVNASVGRRIRQAIESGAKQFALSLRAVARLDDWGKKGLDRAEVSNYIWKFARTIAQSEVVGTVSFLRGDANTAQLTLAVRFRRTRRRHAPPVLSRTQHVDSLSMSASHLSSPTTANSRKSWPLVHALRVHAAPARTPVGARVRRANSSNGPAAIAGALTAWLLATCGSAPPPPIQVEALDALHVVETASVPASLQIVDRPLFRGKIQVGDCAVYSLRLNKGGKEQSWLIRLAVAAHRPWQTGTGTMTADDGQELKVHMQGLLKFHISVTDPEGRLVDESVTGPIATEVLSEGFAVACEFYREFEDLERGSIIQELLDLPEEEQRPVLVSGMAMSTILPIVLEAEALAPLLEAAVRQPSWWSVMSNLNSGITVSFEFHRARPWVQPGLLPFDTAYVFPLDVLAFGERALVASVVAVDSTSPIHTCVGMVSLAAKHPEDETTTLQMQLQAVGGLEAGEIERIEKLAK